MHLSSCCSSAESRNSRPHARTASNVRSKNVESSTAFKDRTGAWLLRRTAYYAH